MTCETIKPMLSELMDETLDVPTAWQVQKHLTDCAECRAVSRDLFAVQQMIHSLPTQQPSAQFDARLAQRLALTRQPQLVPTWRERLFLSIHVPRFSLKPALAFGLALTALAAIIFAPQRVIAPAPPVMPRTVDRVFVADCIAQHRRIAAAEPLADFAAQNLAGRLDSAAPQPSSDGDAAASDAGMF